VGPPSRASPPTPRSRTRSNGRWTPRASRPRTWSATRSAASSRWRSRRAGGRGASSRFQAGLREQIRAAAPQAPAILATPDGRRRATRYLTVNHDHIPSELLAHQMLGAARCDAAVALLHHAEHARWTLDAERITCPVRVVWGADDALLPWPSAAARYRRDWLPHADWVVLDGVGHCPQLDVPLETAQLILGFTTP
jgi:pimeloyl-ACP methyl ester carboxylesterase